MKAQKASIITVLSASCVLTVAFPRPAFSETVSRHNAIELLDETKLIDYEQRIATKKTEMDRLNEDLKKGTEEIGAIEKRISKVSMAVDDATKQLEQFNAQKKRVTSELELLNLRIEAEKLKGDGLRMLQVANKKSQDAVEKRNEETNARTALVAAETRYLATKAPAVPVESGPETSKTHLARTAPKTDLTLTDWRKKLAKAEQVTSLAETQAREAIAAAGVKLQEAEHAVAKAEKKQAEIALDKNPSFPGGNDPLSDPAPITPPAHPPKSAIQATPAKPNTPAKP